MDMNDYEFMTDVPFVIFKIVAGADGKVDKKEIHAFFDILLLPEMFEDEIFTSLVRESVPVPALGVTEETVQMMAYANRVYSDGPAFFRKLKKIIDLNYEESKALKLKGTLIAFTYRIADASGGLFGFGDRVCEEEKQIIDVIAQLLGVSCSSTGEIYSV